MNIHASTVREFWKAYLAVMQSALPKAQRLTTKEIEVLTEAIVLSKDVRVFAPEKAQQLQQALQMTEYALRMHRKNIRNKGWVSEYSLEGLTQKVFQNTDTFEVTVKIHRSAAEE